MAFKANYSFIPFDKKIFLSSPTMHGEELEYVKLAHTTNWMSTIGENINEVERLVADKIGCQYAVGLSCGTAALHLCIKLAGISKGDRVFCSDMTFAATVNPVVYEGAEPIFIDSEYETWNMDPKALERAFEMYPDVKHVIIVHLYGVPAKMDEIKEICARHGATLIEDAAECFGATYKGCATGALSDIGMISFNGNKIVTGSSGGALLTDDAAKATLARKWSTQSREAASWYQHAEMGYNYRMSNVIAGVVRGQLPYLELHMAQKKAIYDRYKKGLEGLPLNMNPFDEENSSPNFWLSCAIINDDAMCMQTRTETASSYIGAKGKSCPDEILEVLARYNAEGRPIWKPMHMQPIYKNNKFVTRNGDGRAEGTECVNEDIFRRGLCLPSDNKMTPAEQDKIIALIRACFK